MFDLTKISKFNQMNDFFFIIKNLFIYLNLKIIFNKFRLELEELKKKNQLFF